MSTLPEPDADETPIRFAFRVARVYHEHVKACPACLNGRGCFACEAGEDSDDPALHACNCEVCEPKGFGVRLRILYVTTRKIREAARRKVTS